MESTLISNHDYMYQSLNEVKLISMPSFKDARGSFKKIFHSLPPLENYHIKQINFVENNSAGILRGLHYQTEPYAEAKIFRVISGAIQLVYFDVRASSETYKKAATICLDDDTSAVLVPRGFATGYAVLRENSSVLYLSDNIYYPEEERGIRWNDPVLDIKWEVEYPLLSGKDKAWKDFK